MSNPNPVVYGAVPDDLPELMRLLRIMHAEGGMFPLDEDCAREQFQRALTPHEKQGIIGVIRGDDKTIQAMMYLVIGRFWYTTQFHLEEIFNFVSPEHRKSNYADALIRYAQHSADELHIPLLIGVLTNNRMEAKVRLYRRRLGMPAGAFFVHNAVWINEHAASDDLWRVHTRGGRHRKKDMPLPLSVATATAAMAIGA